MYVFSMDTERERETDRQTDRTYVHSAVVYKKISNKARIIDNCRGWSRQLSVLPNGSKISIEIGIIDK